MALVKVPVPEPSEVLLLAVVGPVVVLQHTPCALTVAPPSLVTLPPLVAVVDVIADSALVVIAGIVRVVKLISFPYAVPMLLVAYAFT